MTLFRDYDHSGSKLRDSGMEYQLPGATLRALVKGYYYSAYSY